MIPKFSYSLFLLITIISTHTSAQGGAYSCLPMSRSDCNIPQMPVEVQGHTYLVEIDYGSYTQLNLRQEILKDLEKEYIGTSRSLGWDGYRYETPTFLISGIETGVCVFSRATVQELSKEFIINTTNIQEYSVPQISDGLIGRGLLEDMNLILDFERSLVHAYEDEVELKQNLFKSGKFNALRFEKDEKNGIILNAKTDIGNFRLKLDTGCTFSHINPSLVKNKKNKVKIFEFENPIIYTKKFKLGRKNFGKMGLHLLSKEANSDKFDGYLGMDFLDGYAIHFDYENKIMYLGKTNSQIERNHFWHWLDFSFLKKWWLNLF
jgi:hypothetical protein